MHVFVLYDMTEMSIGWIIFCVVIGHYGRLTDAKFRHFTSGREKVVVNVIFSVVTDV